MKVQLLFFLFFLVYNVLGESFFPNDQRAEIFKITDNEVPIFRITLPEKEFYTLKRAANNLSRGGINGYNEEIIGTIDIINSQNFNEIFKGYNIKELLPKLPMNEEGYPTIDYKPYLLSSLNFHYIIEGESDSTTILFNVFNSDSYLNLIEVLYVLSGLEISPEADSDFVDLFSYYGKDAVIVDENGKYSLNIDYSNYYKRQYEEEDESYYSADFKTKNGTLVVEINNDKKKFKKITFSLGNGSSRVYSKPNYNLKIRGDKELFGRRQFKLRGDAADPSFMRTKLMSDIHNRLGLKSLSANYAFLYINDEFMGLQVLTDIYKETWIEYVYGEKNTTNLFKGNNADLTINNLNGYENENKDTTADDTKDLSKFLTDMTNAETATDVESIFELEQFNKEIALEYITIGTDHFMASHNYYIYKQPQNGKWIYLSHDFDLDLDTYTDETNHELTFNDFNTSNMVTKLILSNEEYFKEMIKEIIEKAFNPSVLFPHIDEIKSFIKPYVELDKKPDENGEYPGKINKNSYYEEYLFTLKQWDDSIEFINEKDSKCGLKCFIIRRYRFICKEYGIECDPTYMNENYDMSNGKGEPSTIKEPESESSSSSLNTEKETAVTTKNESVPTSESSASLHCLSEFYGYPCCSPELTEVYAQDDYGDWGYDFSKSEWCGLTKYESSTDTTNDSDNCWSEALGYPCCPSGITTVYEHDEDGDWSYNFSKEEWCGIIKH
ncbi:coth-domain-containing protein [Neocallimastix lanati (nom. inval.)]|jgi:hypothetical protein|nr:coth-domain-containing protein [Neocallimastix sp. JGI-2020a]